MDTQGERPAKRNALKWKGILERMGRWWLDHWWDFKIPLPFLNYLVEDWKMLLGDSLDSARSFVSIQRNKYNSACTRSGSWRCLKWWTQGNWRLTGLQGSIKGKCCFSLEFGKSRFPPALHTISPLFLCPPIWLFERSEECSLLCFYFILYIYFLIFFFYCWFYRSACIHFYIQYIHCFVHNTSVLYTCRVGSNQFFIWWERKSVTSWPLKKSMLRLTGPAWSKAMRDGGCAMERNWVWMRVWCGGRTNGWIQLLHYSPHSQVLREQTPERLHWCFEC